MMKWNPKKRKWELYATPAKWNTSISKDPHEIINCASCGKWLVFDRSYESIQIQDSAGNMYRVCQSCYEKEHQEEKPKKKPIIDCELEPRIEEIGLF